MSDNEPAGPVGVLVRQDPDAFDALRDTAADRLGVDPGAGEKDYWATEVLRSAAAPLDDVDQVVFKGGTSLSKAHGIIERFSEDIDLLVISARTGKPLKRLLRAIADRATVELSVSHEREHEGRGYLNARYYDPGTGQFLTRDPIASATRSAYGYVHGNPLNASDPQGLCARLLSASSALESCDGRSGHRGHVAYELTQIDQFEQNGISINRYTVFVTIDEGYRRRATGGTVTVVGKNIASSTLKRAIIGRGGNFHGNRKAEFMGPHTTFDAVAGDRLEVDGRVNWIPDTVNVHPVPFPPYYDTYLAATLFGFECRA